MVFQIRPAGAPPIDPKPILDGWVKLQSSAIVKAKGRDPFARISPTPGQALLKFKKLGSTSRFRATATSVSRPASGASSPRAAPTGACSRRSRSCRPRD